MDKIPSVGQWLVHQVKASLRLLNGKECKKII